MKKLYILGNGFDLAHGLKTSYQSYRDFLMEKDRNTLSDFESIASKYGQYEKTKLWSNLEKSLSFDIEDILFQADQDYPVNLNGETESEIGWNDIDVEINQTTEFIDDFTGKYFFEWLDSIDISALKPKFSFAPENKFITFNYTNTLGIYGIPETDILHIHGKMDSVVDKTNNSDIRKEIQFGCFENEPKEIDKILRNEYLAVYEDECGEFHPKYEWSFRYESAISDLVNFCTATYKNAEMNYPKINDFLLGENIDEIIVYGLSYGEYDIGYLETISKIYSKAKWTLYGYDIDDRRRAKDFALKNNIEAKIIDTVMSMNKLPIRLSRETLQPRKYDTKSITDVELNLIEYAAMPINESPIKLSRETLQLRKYNTNSITDERDNDEFRVDSTYKCPKCSTDIELNLIEYAEVVYSSDDRPMGVERQYEVEFDDSCPCCGKGCKIEGCIWEYPVLSVEIDETKIYWNEDE